VLAGRPLGNQHTAILLQQNTANGNGVTHACPSNTKPPKPQSFSFVILSLSAPASRHGVKVGRGTGAGRKK
jgi:hypothetical protein